MGVDPITGIAGLVVLTGSALALYLAECERAEEERRQQEAENRRRWRREEKERERDARRQMLKEERERREEMEREERLNRELRQWRRMERERRRREEEAEERRRWNNSSNYEINPFQRLEEYYQLDRRILQIQTDRRMYDDLGSFSRNDNLVENRNCNCWSCRSTRKGSVTISFTQPQTTQDKNQNVKNQGSSNKPTSSSVQRATTSTNTSKQNTSTPKALSSGPNQPQRNNNNNNNNNNSDKKDTTTDYGKLKDFMELLKAILERCKVSKELREKILSFFNNFQKHEENFLRVLDDFRLLNIAIEDIVYIVIRLFQSEYFAQDITYPNFLALMEIVAKYLTDELIFEMVEDRKRGSKKPHEQQRKECMEKVLQRDNIVSDITALFEKIRKEIVEDNDSRPLAPDFCGIFQKVYHYIKHNVIRGKNWTVREYFDWLRKILVLLKNLTPEYEELINVDHARREIVFEMYSSAYEGYFRIVVRAYGPNVYIRTFFLKEKRNRKAKDGEKFVDGKKKS